MKGVFKLLTALLCLCLLLCACTSPEGEQPNDTNAIFSGDYTYEKQPIVTPIEHIDSTYADHKRRDYFLMLFDFVRDQKILAFTGTVIDLIQ